MGKGKTIGYTIGGVILGLIVCIILVIVFGGSRGLLKKYSLDWIIDVIIAVVFGTIIFWYIKKRFNSKKG